VKALKTAQGPGPEDGGDDRRERGDLVKLADFALVVDSSSTRGFRNPYHIGHVLCEMVDRMLFNSPPKSAGSRGRGQREEYYENAKFKLQIAEWNVFLIALCIFQFAMLFLIC